MRVPVAALERLFAIGGFGPAWNSGLDHRRGPRAHDLTAESSDAPSTAHSADPNQLTLFDAEL
jgi:hypothetical protein